MLRRRLPIQSGWSATRTELQAAQNIDPVKSRLRHLAAKPHRAVEPDLALLAVHHPGTSGAVASRAPARRRR